MEVKLLSSTPLSVADIAICKCYSNTPHTTDEKRLSRIDNVSNQLKHESVIEHLVYNFDIDGISRACLQEVARHRIASYTVKSTRYTLKELTKEASFLSQEQPKDEYFTYFMGSLCNFDSVRAKKYIVFTGDIETDISSLFALQRLRNVLLGELTGGTPNDKAKYCMPEAYKTSLVMTINARSLQNFLSLRTDKKALWEIQLLAKAMFEALPELDKQLFTGSVKWT